MVANRSKRFARGRLRTAGFLLGLMSLAACGGDGETGEDLVSPEERVAAKERALEDAQAAYTEASDQFCANSDAYITAIDRYGQVLDEASVTVGDVKAAGADLQAPREEVASSVDDVVAARDKVATAEQELADAQRALEESLSDSPGTTDDEDEPTTTTTLVSPATVDRVEKAESDLAAAAEGINDRTPVAEAVTEYHAAAFALEVAWLRVFADAGCLTDDGAREAEAALHEYVVALQTDLRTAGYYNGSIDGVYGPETLAAVEALQTEAGLPVTGYVDQATAAALEAAVLAKTGADAAEALATTAAVQATLKLAGFWEGPIDGEWTADLTESLKEFQRELGVPDTGVADTATLDALHDRIADDRSRRSTTTAAGDEATTTTTSEP
ncbi:MAG TPA: peptidoglycan-binding domain-containing protein [Microthrixaceae bacterium]|nr:peptidoglycan-binding domain-containing protein [Microthrixaceae bacterium]